MPSFDYTAASAELQALRLTGERQSEKVVALGEPIIKGGYASKLGDQIWLIYEQVAIAALDINNIELGETCIQYLKDRFGEESLRFRRLIGMQLEAQGELDAAKEVYDSILEEDDTNMLAQKRQIALLKARRKDTEAIDALTKYVDIFYDDHEAWMELCELYASNHLYEKAAFCCEELLMLKPNNHIYHVQYAEILYTMNCHPLAMKHYCKALEICSDYPRALYGLQMCSSKLLADNDHASDLNALAYERLLKVYDHQPNTDMRNLVRQYLSSAIQ